MSKFTSINVVLTGLALLLLYSGRGLLWAQVLVFLTGVVSLSVWIGYAFGVESFYGGGGGYISLSFFFAPSFFFFFLGVFFARPPHGGVGAVTNFTARGGGGRGALPAAAGA